MRSPAFTPLSNFFADDTLGSTGDYVEPNWLMNLPVVENDAATNQPETPPLTVSGPSSQGSSPSTSSSSLRERGFLCDECGKSWETRQKLK